MPPFRTATGYRALAKAITHHSLFLSTNLLKCVDGPDDSPRYNVMLGSHDGIWPVRVYVIPGFF